MIRLRAAVAGLGVLLAAYGVVRLFERGWANLRAAVVWLVAGVVLHDGVLGPVVIVAGVLVVRLVPARVRAPVVVGLVVLGTVTATAIPVLGHFGARADNPTLLDRHYVAGWLVFAALVAAGTAAGVVRASRKGR